MTRTEQIIKGLLKLGCKEIESKSRKYRTFRALGLGFYFVGGMQQ